MKQITLYTVLLLLIFMPWKSWSQDIAVSSSIDTNILLIGDQTNINLQLIQPKNKNVYFPVITDKIGDNVEVLNFSKPDTSITSNGELKIDMKILVTSFDTGYFAIPPFEFKYNVLSDSIYSSAQTQALLLSVFPLKVDMEKGIADIKPIIDEPFRIKELLPYFLWFLLISILIAIGIYVYIRIKNNKPIISLPKKPAIPAHIIAKSKLDDLSNKKLWQNGAVKDYYSELTDIMRIYMEGRYSFGAMEMVSDDIIANLKMINIDATLIMDTYKVLQTADFVKFAKVQPLADENSWAMKWAYDFVEKTMPIAKLNEKEEETL